jgi:murein L,D-transpeptidase YcbB/YkuD
MRRLKLHVTGLALAVALGQFTVPAQAASPKLTDASPVQAAVRSSSGGKLSAVYKARAYRPIWFRGSSPTAEANRLIDYLARADLDGLDPDDYGVRRLNEAIAKATEGNPKAIARADVLLSRALIEYVRDLRKPTNVGMTFVEKGLAPRKLEARAILQEMAASGSLDRALQVHPIYLQLRSNYAALQERWGRLPQVTIPPGPTLSSKSKGDRVRLLRMRLGLPEGAAFDKKLAGAVRDFKSAYGLPVTPVADAPTIAVLNMPFRDQAALIRLNLARARMLPAPALGRHVLVDAAAQRLWLYDGDRVVDSMKVIVGKPAEPTPMMAAMIRFATINPYWNVPPDLVAKRIAPGVLSEGMPYLKSKGYEVLSDWADGARPVNPATIDWQAVADGRRELPVRQLPGPANMMGSMKFMFPNELGVYLHDTPEKTLFGEADRRRSSGCVRLEDARRLAKALFGTVPTAPRSAAEYNVLLPKPVPVYITYLTVAPQASGLAFRDDVYGRDRLPGPTRLALAR